MSMTIVSGGCRKGGDRFAEALADSMWLNKTIHYPDQTKLDLKLSRQVAWARISYARNRLIADDSTILIACVAEDRKGGTEDTIQKFIKRHRSTEGQAIAQGILVLV